MNNDFSTLMQSPAALEELGIGPLWVRRTVAIMQADDVVSTGEMTVSTRVSASSQGNATQQVEQTKATEVKEMAYAQGHQEVLPSAPTVTGIPSWLDELDPTLSLSPAFLPDEHEEDAYGVAASLVNPAIASMDWKDLKEVVAICQQCGLCHGRKNTVFGVGDERAKWLFIGEGPGRNEDMQGEPFVGPAGKLLDNMLLAMGVKRGDNAYIANIVKCRPVGENGRDRPPLPQEVAACLPYLQRQIALIQPTVLVALGKTAALALLGLDPSTPVSTLRGKLHRYQELPLIVTYHPAYLLRQPSDKSKVWADLCLAMTTYAQSTP